MSAGGDGRFDAVLFDKDGTLFDFHATWSTWAEGFVNRLAAQTGARPDRLAGAIGFDPTARRFRRDSPVIAATPDEVAQLLAPHVPGLSFSGLVTRLNREAACARVVEAVPLAPLLTGLRASGLRLGVATNDAEAPARAHLAAAGVHDLFDLVLGADSGHGGKPGPGQLVAFAATFGLSARRVAMVGDSLHDLAAARAAGMAAVAVLTGPAAAEDLAPHADAVLPDIGHLPGWLVRPAP